MSSAALLWALTTVFAATVEPSDSATAPAAVASGSVTEPSVSMKGGPFKLTLTGYFQVDTVVLDQSSEDQVNPSSGQPLNQNRILLRRGRIRFDADQGIFSAGLELDGNTWRGLSVGLIQADVSARWANPDAGAPPYLAFSAGLLQIPFGFETQHLARSRFFLEPPNFSRALFPGSYDVGLRLAGGWRMLRYQLAWMNGEPLEGRQLPGLDPNSAKDWIARVGVAAHPVESITLEAGVSGLEGTGFHAGTTATKDTTVWRDLNEDGIVQPTELNVVPGAAATPSFNFRRFALGADLRFQWESARFGTLTLRGEVVRAVDLDRGQYIADPVSAGRSFRELGAAVTAMYELPWAVTVGARYDVYNPDADANEQLAAERVPLDVTSSTLALTAGWRYQKLARAVLELDLNRNALGRTAAGLPTTLAATVLTLRLEVAF